MSLTLKRTGLSEKEITKRKTEKLMASVAYWGAYYRANPHKFCKDYLNINLKLFQKILLFMMMTSTHFMYLASRGQGKTFLTAIFCVVRCILYPGTKICIAAGTRKQGNEVLSKIIDELMINNDWGSALLRNEIEDYIVNQNEGWIKFRNGSWIKVVTSRDSARGARANILIVDEFRMVDKKILDSVLKKFLTDSRHPKYLDKKEYQHLAERNKEIYLSSCWYKSHWSYEKAKSFVVNTLRDDKRYFICGLPYQIAIKEGLLQREQVEDEMSEMDFDELAFSIEMECLWYGDTDGAFFKFDDVSRCRGIKIPLNDIFYPKRKIPDLVYGERRIMSVDIALMASKKNNNDASSIIINSAIPVSDTEYKSRIVFLRNYEGLTTDDLGLKVMQLFYKYKCTDLVLDTNGAGIGVFDYVILEHIDPDTGDILRAFDCCNDPMMSERCKVKNANKCLWSIKATESFNSKMYTRLRSALQNRKIDLLISEFAAEEELADSIKNFNNLSAIEQTIYKDPYVQTTLLIYELINLQTKINNGKVKMAERSGMRKDRVSSLGYNYSVLWEIQKKMQAQTSAAQFKYKPICVSAINFD